MSVCRALLCLLPLSSLACAASQEVRAMHRELSVQVSRLEDALSRELAKSREELKASASETQRRVGELRERLDKIQGAIEAKIAALEGKVRGVSSEIAELKKASRAPGVGAVTDLEVRAVGENHYRVSRKQFEERAYELSRLISQMAFAPYFEGDRRAGVRIVETNGLVERFGILPGDVVVSVNGLALIAAEQIREAMKVVRHAPEVNVVVLRAGQKMTYKITVGP